MGPEMNARVQMFGTSFNYDAYESSSMDKQANDKITPTMVDANKFNNLQQVAINGQDNEATTDQYQQQ